MAMTGGEVVQTRHALPKFEQGFHQIGTDKAGRTGNQPMAGVLAQVGLDFGQLVHNLVLSW